MKKRSLSIGIALAVGGSAAAAQDADPALLLERLAAPATPSIAPSSFGFTTPRVVFTRSGQDNATSLYVHPDANGDGVPDVALGWNIDQDDDNLELISGAGFGSADVLWSLETQDGISGGYYSEVDQLAGFPDVTGDGVGEILSGSSGGGRAATLYDGATGAVLQSFNTYLGAQSGWVYQVLAVPDVNGSGTDDFVLVTGSNADAVYMVEGSLAGVHHDELWSFQALDAVFAVDLLGDVDGDGITDLVVAAGDNADRLHGLSGADGHQLWVQTLSGSPWDLAAYPDVTGDGVSEVAVAVWSAAQGVQLRDGATGTALWTSGVPGAFGMDVVPFEDVNGDGRPEIAVASWADRAFAVSGLDGALLWQSPLSGGDVWAVDRVDDVTGDGISEIAWGSFDGFAYLADGATGVTLWSHSADGRKVLSIRGAPDLDGDGAPEVIAGGQQLSSGTATLLWVVDANSTLHGPGPELRADASVALGALNDLRVLNATPGNVLLWILGVEPALLPNVGFGWPGIFPAELILDFTSFAPPNGRASLPLVIPVDPTLVGAEVYFQVFDLLPAFPFPGTSTNRIGFTILP
jgi:hypothetical protein